MKYLTLLHYSISAYIALPNYFKHLGTKVNYHLKLNQHYEMLVTSTPQRKMKHSHSTPPDISSKAFIQSSFYIHSEVFSQKTLKPTSLANLKFSAC